MIAPQACPLGVHALAYAWISPNRTCLSFHFDGRADLAMVRAEHPDVAEDDWRAVVGWIRAAPDRNVTVASSEGIVFRGAAALRGDSDDFDVSLGVCAAGEWVCARGDPPFRLASLDANFVRAEMDPREPQFALQAVLGALVVAPMRMALARCRAD